MTFSTKRILSARLSRSTRHGAGGFTLVELLIAIAIAAILMAIAVPSFRTMSRNMAVRGAADEFVAGVQFARSEAIRTNQTISLTLAGRTWQALDGNDAVLREGVYSDQINAQDTARSFTFTPTGMITSDAGSFPISICLTAVDDPSIERRILFPARAASPVIQAACPWGLRFVDPPDGP